MINVLIADNQTLTREGVIAVLSDVDDIDIAGTASTQAELEKMIQKLRPDVIIIDHHFNNGFNIEAIKKGGVYKLLVLSNNKNREHILEVIGQGIRNYIFKECSREEIIKAVYATAKGDQFFCDHILRSLDKNHAEVTGDIDHAALSHREAEIVQLIAEGMTNKDIAGQLFLSIHTIKTHRKNIIKKLGFTFKNAADLMIYAERIKSS